MDSGEPTSGDPVHPVLGAFKRIGKAMKEAVVRSSGNEKGAEKAKAGERYSGGFAPVVASPSSRDSSSSEATAPLAVARAAFESPRRKSPRTLSQLYDEGFELAAKSKSKEAEGQLQVAHSCLVAAVECFLSASRLERNADSRALLKRKSAEFIARAEELASRGGFQPVTPISIASSGGGGGGGSGSGSGAGGTSPVTQTPMPTAVIVARVTTSDRDQAELHRRKCSMYLGVEPRVAGAAAESVSVVDTECICMRTRVLPWCPRHSHSLPTPIKPT